MLTKNEKQLLAIAQQQLASSGYTKEDMYADLSDIAGRNITTRTDPDLNHGHFKAMLQLLKSHGFKQITNRPEPPEYDHSDLKLRPPNFASKEQVDKIVELWQFVNRGDNWTDTLNSFLGKRFHIQNYRWIKKSAADSVIEALKSMYLRKILKQAFVAIFNDPDIVENRMLQLYRLIKAGFLREEMAALLTVFILGEDKFDDKMKTISKIFKQSNFTKLIGG